MSRPSRDETLMGVAHLWASHSTCARLAVGAAVSRDGRTFSTGYNGAPAGMPHCDHTMCTCQPDPGTSRCPSCDHEASIHDSGGRCWFTVGQGVPNNNLVCQCQIHGDVRYEPDGPTAYQVDHCPMHGACRTAVHAELNALMYAARFGLATEGAEIHTTHQPCLNCAMAIVNAGIVRVVFWHPYRDNGGLDLLQAAGVHIMQPHRDE